MIMTQIDNLPALLFRMTISKQIHDQVGDPRDTLDQVLGRAYDMGDDDERQEVQAWTDRQPDSFESAAAFTGRANAIAAIHRLTTEGGGTGEQ
ncbi:hypothetical protein LCGC14_0334950 [marine sediment metagenome]|uniref:Uncharacterized protein n=1 Tax=marine sediment metagenome TaxID=412755 RepID=A0A0F9TYE3_9ZZZZ